jgi:hypothetical protein
MLSNSASDREAILAAYDELDAAFDKVLGHSLDVLTHSELLTLQSRMERNLRRAPAVEHRILNRLATEASPTALGGTSLADVLATRLRISKGEARRRIEDAEKLGARTALTGEPLEPLWPNTAAAHARLCCTPRTGGQPLPPRRFSNSVVVVLALGVVVSIQAVMLHTQGVGAFAGGGAPTSFSAGSKWRPSLQGRPPRRR